MTAWLAILVPVLVAFFGWCFWWRAHATKDVYRVVVEMRTLLKDAIAVGGLDTSRFLVPELQRAEEELEDLLGRVNNGKLRDGCALVLKSYRQTFAAAPAPQNARVYNLAAPMNPFYIEQDRQRAQQMEREVAHAHEALDVIAAVLLQVNKLERFTPRRG